MLRTAEEDCRVSDCNSTVYVNVLPLVCSVYIFKGNSIVLLEDVSEIKMTNASIQPRYYSGQNGKASPEAYYPSVTVFPTGKQTDIDSISNKH